jgi:glutamyl-tRNA reductase
MDSLGIVGISTKGHDTATLARFTIAREDRVARLPALATALGVRELIYLGTCNRVELIFRCEPGDAGKDLRRAAFAALTGTLAGPGEAERTLRGWTGEGAIEHLFLVAAGLDSAQLGEREIQGQLRQALLAAREAGTAGTMLDRITEEALRVAHQVHRHTSLGSGRVSLAEIAADFLLERVRRTPGPVALIGVTPMTRRAAEALAREQVAMIFVNRTVARAEELAAELGGSALSLDAFRARPPQVEAVLTATGAPAAVLDRAAAERLAARPASGEPPLVVDLALPPDVEPEVACAAHLPRIGMDEINAAARHQRELRLAESAAARELVDQALRDVRARLAERLLAPVLAQLNQRYRQTAHEGVERLLGKEGLTLGEHEREVIARWAETLARRFAHLPALGLRGLAAEEGMLAVRSFLAAGDAELFGEFCRTANDFAWLSETLEGAAAPSPAALSSSPTASAAVPPGRAAGSERQVRR